MIKNKDNVLFQGGFGDTFSKVYWQTFPPGSWLSSSSLVTDLLSLAYPCLCFFLGLTLWGDCTGMTAQLQKHSIFLGYYTHCDHSVCTLYELSASSPSSPLFLLSGSQTCPNGEVIDISCPLNLWKMTALFVNFPGNDLSDWASSSRLSERCFPLPRRTHSVTEEGFYMALLRWKKSLSMVLRTPF